MAEQQTVGVFGKIPAHGDFVAQDLPRDFTDSWDHWLQQSILASQESLGDQWLQHFLVSPIWRFALPSGAVNNQSWAGIILPSVDSVGRYYPLTLIAQIPGHVGVFEYVAAASEWFEKLENVAITTLEKGMTVNELAQELTQLKTVFELPLRESSPLGPQQHQQHSIPLEFPEQSITSITPLLCDALLKPQMPTLSIWWTKGGQHVDPALLLADKLPRPTSYTAMLNGQWENWHWPSLIHAL